MRKVNILVDFVDEVERRGTFSVKWDKRAEVFPNSKVTPLWVADADWPTAPAIISALQRRVEHGVFGYTFAGDRHYQAIIDWYNKRYDYEIKKEWLVFLNGVMPGINLLLRSLRSQAKSCLLQPPVYFPFSKAIRNSGLEKVENPLTFEEELYYEIDWKDLKRKIEAKNPAYLLFCYPHNPVGRVWQDDELLKLLRICAAKDILIISDEIHADFTYQQKFKPLTMIAAENLNKRERPDVISLNSPSKSFNIAGLHIAYAIIPETRLRKKFQRALSGIIPGPNPLALSALVAAYTEGEEWLDNQLEYLEANISLVQDYLQQLPNLKFTKPEGTYLMWLDFSEIGLGNKKIANKLYQEAEVGLQPGKWFGTGGENFYRLNLATKRERLEMSLQRLIEVIN